ncbi:hypothetical protein JCM6882_007141 [Rhodosporidiobolus microsporus]
MLQGSDCVPVEPYQSGAKPGGLRAWWTEHEAFVKQFYSEPPLVSAQAPNRWKMFLSDSAFMARERGRPYVSESARFVKIVLKRPSIMLALARFEAKTLVPEFSLSSLCSGEGRGLARLLDKVNSSLDGVISSSVCIPDRDFFVKFGLEQASGSIPHSRANRAYQDEIILLRHTMLFSLLYALLDKLGVPVERTTHSVGAFAADDAPENLPYGPKEDADEMAVPESCGHCKRTAAEAKLTNLLRCGACWKVKRVEPYCSRECQVAAFPKHKAAGCGRKLSEFAAVPDFATSLPTAAGKEG